MFFTVSELFVSPRFHNNKIPPLDQKGGDEDGEGPNPPEKEASDVKSSTKEPGLELVFVILLHKSHKHLNSFISYVEN